MLSGKTHRFNDVRLLKETILATMPEGQVSAAMCNYQIVIEWMEGGTAQSLLQGLCKFIFFIVCHTLQFNPFRA